MVSAVAAAGNDAAATTASPHNTEAARISRPLTTYCLGGTRNG
jgi:hypothetical protein